MAETKPEKKAEAKAEAQGPQNETPAKSIKKTAWAPKTSKEWVMVGALVLLILLLLFFWH